MSPLYLPPTDETRVWWTLNKPPFLPKQYSYVLLNLVLTFQESLSALLKSLSVTRERSTSKDLSKGGLTRDGRERWLTAGEDYDLKTTKLWLNGGTVEEDHRAEVYRKYEEGNVDRQNEDGTKSWRLNFFSLTYLYLVEITVSFWVFRTGRTKSRTQSTNEREQVDNVLDFIPVDDRQRRRSRRPYRPWWWLHRTYGCVLIT